MLRSAESNKEKRCGDIKFVTVLFNMAVADYCFKSRCLHDANE